ncbi:hypothetical protein [Actinomadura sp. 9N215]|uniref:hypothetical protein n=1 Tax=Actinomadura sp. 9N215 TaxID=3375150 RepID=UPI0037A48D38
MSKATPSAASVTSLAEEAERRETRVTFGDGPDAITLVVPRRWQRFKFLRRINSGDIIGALESVFGVEQVERLDEIDIDEKEFSDVLETLAEALGGTSAGNSSASPTSR